MSRLGIVQWSTRSARDRLNSAGFIHPCLPVRSEQIPTEPEWMHGLRWDGCRVLAFREDDKVPLWSRNVRDWAGTFPCKPIQSRLDSVFLADLLHRSHGFDARLLKVGHFDANVVAPPEIPLNCCAFLGTASS